MDICGICIESFSSPRSVAVLRGKGPICPTIFVLSWRENSWIHAFPKNISSMWNANSLILNLNSGRRVHSPGRHPLHQYRLVYCIVTDSKLHYIPHTSLYAIKHNQTKPDSFTFTKNPITDLYFIINVFLCSLVFIINIQYLICR